MCRFFKLLYRLFPFKTLKSFLIEKHFAVCPHCQKDTEIESQLKTMLAIPSWIEKEESMWPKIKERFSSQRKKSFKADKAPGLFLFKKWKWAAAGLVMVIAVGAVLIVYMNFQRKPGEAEALMKETPRVVIEHAEINGKKARPYIYQTPEISYIWFSEAKNNGG